MNVPLEPSCALERAAAAGAGATGAAPADAGDASSNGNDGRTGQAKAQSGFEDLAAAQTSTRGKRAKAIDASVFHGETSTTNACLIDFGSAYVMPITGVRQAQKPGSGSPDRAACILTRP